MKLKTLPGPGAEKTLVPGEAVDPKALDDTRDLIKAEHQKAVDEIKLRIEQEDTWYHYKFVLVGGMLALLLGNLVWGDMGSQRLDQRLKLLGSEATCSVLALASVIALAIDIHNRNNIMVIQQLGIWIANFVEPALLHKAVDLSKAELFVPWEQFLRSETPGGMAMHRDDWYGFIFYPHLHFFTWIIYISYLGFFQELALNKVKETSPVAETTSLEKLAIATFIMVHLTLGVFTCIAHFAPSTFEFKLVPWANWWTSGRNAVVFFLIPWGYLVLLNLPYLIFLVWPKCFRMPSTATNQTNADATPGAVPEQN